MIDGNLELLNYFLTRAARLKELKSSTVLDIGACHESAELFTKQGCDVTAVNYANIAANDAYSVVVSNFLFWQTKCRFDIIWCSHVLEHVSNVNLFLRKLISHSADDAYLGIVIPPVRDALVGGHINMFNPATLCYSVILAGQNLSQATVMQYRNNIALIWRRCDLNLPNLILDRGDIEVLEPFFPIPVYQDCPGTDGWESVRCDDFAPLHLKTKFTKEFDELLTGFEHLPSKFRDADLLWNRYSTVVEHMKSMGWSKGLDFGPGSCPGLIIGRLFDVEVQGIDVPKCLMHNWFQELQHKAITKGYKVHLCPTTSYPWAYEDSVFDCVFAFDALFVEWMQHIDFKTNMYLPDIIQRVNELMRIVKPNGGIYIGGTNDAEVFCTIPLENTKNIQFFEWRPFCIDRLQC